ncbi:hypothetical protein BOX15_Mlig022228g1, partial [Macrostomum lignano]
LLCCKLYSAGMKMSAPADPLHNSVSLRRLYPPDTDDVKCLAKHLFPIDYPDSWFHDIVTNDRFYTQAALLGNEMVAMLVAEVKPIAIVNKEDADLLSCQFPPETKVCYLLSIGVSQPYRRRGLARLLLSNLLSHLHASLGSQVKCVYLHVLATNRAAIEFYQGQGFQLHCRLPFYYVIEGRPADACSYALYLNDGCPPESCLQTVARSASLVASCVCSRLLSVTCYCRRCHLMPSCLYSIVRRLGSIMGLSCSDSITNSSSRSCSVSMLLMQLKHRLVYSATGSQGTLSSSTASV